MLQHISKKSPDPFDIAVGQRVRRARMAAGMSQEKLGDALGLTFQQVQKYEKGTNRIAPSRLRIIAEAVGISVAQLFDDAGTAHIDDPINQLAADRVGYRLARAFGRITDDAVKLALVQLAESLA